jgi:GT2 family glycosyltransferase
MEELKRNKPIVSVLIPTRNNDKDLIDCLDSIGHLDFPSNKIVIIIWDNNSRQECKSKVKDFLAHMTKEKQIRSVFIEHDNNYGVHTSRDELFKRVSADVQFALSIDDDVMLPPQLFRDLFSEFHHDNLPLWEEVKRKLSIYPKSYGLRMTEELPALYLVVRLIQPDCIVETGVSARASFA